jgi:hypothetical protein
VYGLSLNNLQQKKCTFKRTTVGAEDTGFVDLPEGDEEQLKGGGELLLRFRKVKSKNHFVIFQTKINHLEELSTDLASLSISTYELVPFVLQVQKNKICPIGVFLKLFDGYSSSTGLFSCKLS